MFERIKEWLRSYWARALFCLLVVFSAGSEAPGGDDRLAGGAGDPSCLPSQPYSAAIREIVEEELRGLRGRHAVGVLDLGTGEGYLRDARGIYPSASLYKLYVMHAAFSLASAGEISFNDRITINQVDASEFEPVGGLRVGQTLAIRDALRPMITISSNAAGRSLLRNLGRGVGSSGDALPRPVFALEADRRYD